MIGMIRRILDSDGRAAARRAIRLKLAETELAERRLHEIAAELRELDLAADRAADEHSTITGPLQTELDAIEQRMLARLADRQPTSAKDDSKRAELLSKLATANDTLESAVSAVNKQRARLNDEMRAKNLGVISGERQSLVSSLAAEGIADPDLCDQLAAARDAAQWASARLQAASKKLREIMNDLDIAKHNLQRGTGDKATLSKLEAVARRWRIVEGDARRQLAAAQQQVDQLRQRAIDE